MIVFNVGGALCSYLEINGTSILIDVGSSNEFNPIKEFLIPYFSATDKPKVKEGKYCFGQLLISHPHHDHISLLKDFSDYFFPELITCPNDKSDNALLNIDWNLFFPDGTTIHNQEITLLKKLYEKRNLPLRPILQNDNYPDRQYIYYLEPGYVARNDELTTNGETYANNISLVSIFNINGFHILFPGDIMKNGIKHLLAHDNSNGGHTFKKGLNSGIDILIAPHHGLESAFSENLFSELPDGKVNCINIVSEKQNSPKENRDVDKRYANANYCKGDNNLQSTNGADNNCQRKTSQGHICIDFNHYKPIINIFENIKDAEKWFTQQ